MATVNDRAILNSIINPLQPAEEFTDNLCNEVLDSPPKGIILTLIYTNKVDNPINTNI